MPLCGPILQAEISAKLKFQDMAECGNRVLAGNMFVWQLIYNATKAVHTLRLICSMVKLDKLIFSRTSGDLRLLKIMLGRAFLALSMLTLLSFQ